MGSTGALTQSLPPTCLSSVLFQELPWVPWHEEVHPRLGPALLATARLSVSCHLLLRHQKPHPSRVPFMCRGGGTSRRQHRRAKAINSSSGRQGILWVRQGGFTERQTHWLHTPPQAPAMRQARSWDLNSHPPSPRSSPVWRDWQDSIVQMRKLRPQKEPRRATAALGSGPSTSEVALSAPHCVAAPKWTLKGMICPEPCESNLYENVWGLGSGMGHQTSGLPLSQLLQSPGTGAGASWALGPEDQAHHLS